MCAIVLVVARFAVLERVAVLATPVVFDCARLFCTLRTTLLITLVALVIERLIAPPLIVRANSAVAPIALVIARLAFWRNETLALCASDSAMPRIAFVARLTLLDCVITLAMVRANAMARIAVLECVILALIARATVTTRLIALFELIALAILR